MINGFLVQLTRLQSQPQNPASEVGNIYWPEYQPAPLSTEEQQSYDLLFVDVQTPLHRLLRAIQLLWVVLDSPLGQAVTHSDTRMTYDTPQLQGQFEGMPADALHISYILGHLPVAPPGFLSAELARVYRSSVTQLDKLAALACHFGTLND